METHHIGTHHLRTQLGDNYTIDGDHTCLNELVGFATAAHSGIGKIFVQTNRLIGIIVLLLILYPLLHAILCIGIVVGCALTIAALTLLIATLLGTTVTALTLLVATLLRTTVTALTLLIAALLLGTTVTALTLLITALLLGTTVTALTLLITALLLRTTVTALTLLIASLLLIAILIIPRTVAALLAWLIALALRIASSLLTRLIALTLRSLCLQTSAEPLGTESALIIIIALVVTWTLVSHSRTLSHRNARTR